jgi:uncharacterized protein (TIGR03083 family)
MAIPSPAPSRFLECLSTDYHRLREVAAKDLDAPVPSCPGWSVTDLVRHVAEVYLHKVEAMRQQQVPRPWPPPEIERAEPLPLLERAWAELAAEFATRRPEAPAYTWYEPDQTVGFWIRRMAQETVIHRIDAELALTAGGSAGVPGLADGVQRVADDLAVDGIDEVLVVFLAYASARWPEDFGDDLAQADKRPILVSSGGATWVVRAAPDGVHVSRGDPAAGLAPAGAEAPGATVRGAPEAMLRWLWGRGEEGVSIDGDHDLVAGLRRLLVIATQ